MNMFKREPYVKIKDIPSSSLYFVPNKSCYALLICFISLWIIWFIYISYPVKYNVTWCLIIIDWFLLIDSFWLITFVWLLIFHEAFLSLLICCLVTSLEVSLAIKSSEMYMWINFDYLAIHHPKFNFIKVIDFLSVNDFLSLYTFIIHLSNQFQFQDLPWFFFLTFIIEVNFSNSTYRRYFAFQLNRKNRSIFKE